MNKELTFGAFVRERRHALALTQEELARQAGCAAITLRKIEAGDLRVSGQIAERLAIALAIPAEERDEFVRWARTVQPVEIVRPRRQVGACPYRGLAAFQEADAPFYFGREGFVDELEHSLRTKRLVAGI